MKIWIDADACPNVIKEIIFKAALRKNIKVILVANRFIKSFNNPLISIIKVPQGFDMADSRIIDDMSLGDIVITSDIPLADAAIDKGGLAINHTGKLYTKENIKDRLATRDLLMHLRDSGISISGPKALGLKERQAFANALDRLLAKVLSN